MDTNLKFTLSGIEFDLKAQFFNFREKSVAFTLHGSVGNVYLFSASSSGSLFYCPLTSKLEMSLENNVIYSLKMPKDLGSNIVDWANDVEDLYLNSEDPDFNKDGYYEVSLD